MLEPPEWFALTEVADNYTHSFGADKRSRNYTVFQSTNSRFFMLREGVLIYYVDESKPKGCIDLYNAKVTKKSADSLVVEPGAKRDRSMELVQVVITERFLEWKQDRPRESQPKSEDFEKVAADEVCAALRLHISLAHLKKNFSDYFDMLLDNQDDAVKPNSSTWHRLHKHMQDLFKFINNEKNMLGPLLQHSESNGGGAHPLVQKLWQSYALLLYLQVEVDLWEENPYIPEMVRLSNLFIQSCLARSVVIDVEPSEYDNNDPTMVIVRLNQVLAIQKKYDEYTQNTKLLIDYSLNRNGPNLLACIQCLMLAITLRDELGDKAQGTVWAKKAVEIFESSPNKDHHPLVEPKSEEERRENLAQIMEGFQ